MKVPSGAIDCDIHPAVPSTAALLRYLPDYWHDQFLNRHIERYPFTLMSFPPNTPPFGVTREAIDEAAKLGRMLGFLHRPQLVLRDEYRRVTRRARDVVERVFYGRTER